MSSTGAPEEWANGRSFVDEWQKRERLKLFRAGERGEFNLKDDDRGAPLQHS